MCVWCYSNFGPLSDVILHGIHQKCWNHRNIGSHKCRHCLSARHPCDKGDVTDRRLIIAWKSVEGPFLFAAMLGRFISQLICHPRNTGAFIRPNKCANTAMEVPIRSNINFTDFILEKKRRSECPVSRTRTMYTEIHLNPVHCTQFNEHFQSWISDTFCIMPNAY